MNKIYLVEGIAGSYGDSETWIIGAYESEDEAKDLVSGLEAMVSSYDSMLDMYRPGLILNFRNAGFPEGCIPSFGDLYQLSYTVREVPFIPAAKHD